MPDHERWWFTLIRSMPDHPCTYKGQTAYISKVENLEVYAVLKCGHPLWLSMEDIEHFTDLVLEPCEICGAKTAVLIDDKTPKCFATLCQRVLPVTAAMRGDSKMTSAETTIINNDIEDQSQDKGESKGKGKGEGKGKSKGKGKAKDKGSIKSDGNGNGNGILRASSSPVKGIMAVNGLSKEVMEYATMVRFLDLLEAQVEEKKAMFREHAQNVYDNAYVKPKEVRFMSEDGATAVPVTMPDLEKPSSKRVLPDKLLKQLLKRGVNVRELDIAQISEEIKLTGAWIEMARRIEQHYVSKGLPIPEGTKTIESLKLTNEGIEKVYALMADADPKAYEGFQLLLKEGLRAPAVKVD